jgi:hypothetical protein
MRGTGVADSRSAEIVALARGESRNGREAHHGETWRHKASGKALLAAIARGDHATLQCLLKSGAPVEARDPTRAVMRRR